LADRKAGCLKLTIRGRVILGLAVAGLIAAMPAAAQQSYRVRGSPDAAIELTIYSDFECPFCRNFALAAMPGIVAEFADRGLVRLRYVFLPLASIHRNAVTSAKAAHCAGMAGRFWAYHDYLYVRQPEWAGPAAPDSVWITYASNLGLDTTAFRQCLQAPDTNAAIEQDLREALGSGATGTPTIVLGERSLTGLTSYEELRQQIVAAIEAARGNGQPADRQPQPIP